MDFTSVVGLFASLVKLIADFFNLHKHYKEDKKKFYILLGLICVGILVMSFYVRSCSKINNPTICDNLIAKTSKFLNKGTPSHGNYNYVTRSVAGILVRDSLRFETSRKEQLNRLLLACDSVLLKEGHGTYGYKLADYLNGEDAISKIVTKNLLNRSLVYIDEDLYNEQEKCYYKLSVSVDTGSAKYIDALTAMAKDSICFDTVLESIVCIPLQTNSSVTISFVDILSNLSTQCNSSSRGPMSKILALYRENPNAFYFDVSKFELSAFSMIMLDRLYKKLLKRNATRWILEFHGYTDHKPFENNNIPCNEVIIADTGTLLPNENTSGQRRISSITNNNELSFARANSCWRYLFKEIDNKVEIKYTGHGECLLPISDNECRSVQIIIKRNL